MDDATRELHRDIKDAEREIAELQREQADLNKRFADAARVKKLAQKRLQEEEVIET